MSKFGDTISAKDGGFVFQAIISHDVKWKIVNGETQINPSTINATLHQVDVFPDIKLTSGTATSTYVVLSDVNLLKRKFELASEALKKRLSPTYAQEIINIGAGKSSTKKSELNLKYFANTYYECTLSTSKIVLREVSTSGLDTGSPKIVMKVSTGMVDMLNGVKTHTWDAFNIKVDGTSELVLTNSTTPIHEITEVDDIENINDIVFQTILPSLFLEFKGDSVIIDTYTNRSTQANIAGMPNYNDAFAPEDIAISALSNKNKALAPGTSSTNQTTT